MLFRSYRLICTDDMTNADVTGCWQPSANGSWSWLEGAGIRAWKGNGTIGGRLVIDEIDKAGGDVFATLLAITDTPDSAQWEHPSTKEIVKPLDGFTVVMTTNIEDMNELIRIQNLILNTSQGTVLKNAVTQAANGLGSAQAITNAVTALTSIANINTLLNAGQTGFTDIFNRLLTERKNSKASKIDYRDSSLSPDSVTGFVLDQIGRAHV